MTTVKYDIGTGYKSEYYTLWKTTTVDQRPRDEEGNVTETFKLNSVGGNMYYHVHVKFVQNLSKTKEGAIAKIREMGISESDIPLSSFDFDLKHYSKPSFEAFGVKMKHRKGRENTNRWFAEASQDFWKCWKETKDTLKSFGWSCWRDEKTNKWYMGIRIAE